MSIDLKAFFFYFFIFLNIHLRGSKFELLASSSDYTGLVAERYLPKVNILRRMTEDFMRDFTLLIRERERERKLNH